MSFKTLKLELFYLRLAFLQYKKGFTYIYRRYVLAPKILKSKTILEKPINNNDLSIHVLTSHKDILMLVWSLYSFYIWAEEIGQLYIHSDGSLTEKDKKILKKLFPSVQVVDFAEKVLAKIEKYPPIKKFYGRKKYILLKKFLDPYFISDKKIRLIIDSDILWFKNPEEITREIKNGAEKSLMASNMGIPCPIYFKNGEADAKLALYNSGIVLYNQDNFNLEKLNKYFELFDETNEKNTHFIEQFGYAYVLDDLEMLPDNKYVIKEKITDATVSSHYTSPLRCLFYLQGLDYVLN